MVNPESPDREEPSSNIDNIAKIDFAFEKSLKVGDSHILKLIIEYKDGTKKDVTKDTRFLIEDSSVAIIKNGNIKGLTQGETKLTAEYEGIKAITSIVVKTIVIEEPINPNDPILVDGNLNINPISIKGFVFTHNTNWWRDDNSENPKYILNNGKFVKPTWLDEANNTHIDMPVPNEEKSFVGNYEINNEKDLFTMAYHVVFYRGGADLTKDEIYNAVKKVQSTKNSVKLNKYTFSIKQFEGSPEFVNITNY
ncbi:hypothetical protein JCM21714_2114 [Gracilibacillus boraciitolerans JCM 21714]|uniref:BIG2 domain-containing protein n=1 Tax=Gracilibacillus boraciitolerans JCM 21714 TaxID=1298598 RepID=W4VIP1_9BACI|nr:hypothetical protein [Gracilibacillus boraciitolerans]GAE93077.1 hypothetical protein JCM21714_2114 [Gracilibacillus boraciitolerans JCM 21714]